jgi:hypothetical protein
VDSVASRGGNRAKLLPGTWQLRDSVVSPLETRLICRGVCTDLTRPVSVSTQLAADSNWYVQEITARDSSGLRPDDGDTLRATNPHNGALTIIKRQLISSNGNHY